MMMKSMVWDKTLSVTKNLVYRLVNHNIEETKYKNIFDYYSIEWQMTPKTIELNENYEMVSTETQINFSNENRFNERFEELSQIGSGGFKTVVKVEDKCTKRINAVKKFN